MAADPTQSNFFTPTDNDYAIGILRRLFGDIVTTLLGDGGTTTGSAILPAVIGAFNVAILFFATIVAAYMFYQLFLDTARDGEFGGRENNLAVTALRAGVGAALLLPVKGGLSVVQILFVQMLLLCSGLADTVWKTAAGQMQSAATYTVSATNSGDSHITAQKMAGVLATRTAGYLCMLHANGIARTVSGEPDEPESAGGNPQKPAIEALGPIPIDRSGDETALYWYFGASEKYDDRSGVCGSTKLVLTNYQRKIISSDIYSSTKTFAEDLADMTNATVLANGRRAVENLDRTAEALAKAIYAGRRDTEDYKRLIRQAVDTETANFISGVNASVTSGPQAQAVESLKRRFLEATTDNGWMFAATWQRALAAYITQLNNARNQLSFVNSTEVSPKAASSGWGAMIGYSSIEKRLYAAIDQDFEYLATLDGAFIEAGEARAADTQVESEGFRSGGIRDSLPQRR